MKAILRYSLTVLTLTLPAIAAAGEPEPASIERVVAVKNVCAWPNLTLMRDGTITAILHNQPAHGQQEGDIDCWGSRDGLTWEKLSTVTRHEPHTVRMNHAAGLAKNGELVVLCSGWTDVKHPDRPKQAGFRDDILRPWALRSKDGGRTWEKSETFPGTEPGWSEQIPFGNIWAGDDGALHTSCYQGQFADPTKSSKIKAYRAWHFESDDDGKTWGKPLRLAHTVDGGDCGYPSSVQLAGGRIVTAWYSKETPDYAGYHMGATAWEAPEVR
jgi:hypothetical protein